MKLSSHADAAVKRYIRSGQRLVVRRVGGKIDRAWKPASLSAVESLERLGRVHGEYKLAKAWQELPPIAFDALTIAADRNGEPLRKVMLKWKGNREFFTVPDRADLATLVPAAIKIARTFGARKVERDQAVVAILEDYARMNGRAPTAKPAKAFIRDVEIGYKVDFGIGESAATLQRLINAAK